MPTPGGVSIQKKVALAVVGLIGDGDSRAGLNEVPKISDPFLAVSDNLIVVGLHTGAREQIIIGFTLDVVDDYGLTAGAVGNAYFCSIYHGHRIL